LIRMMLFACLLFSFFVTASPPAVACEKTEPLFVIAHNKNGNAVHYEACLDRDGSLSVSEPVIAYWMLEDGRREELISIERKHAYGVLLREIQGKVIARISVVSLPEKEITVRKIGRHFRAFVPIDGKQSILERAYLKSDDRFFRLGPRCGSCVPRALPWRPPA
jgi:hypothetical protein